MMRIPYKQRFIFRSQNKKYLLKVKRPKYLQARLVNNYDNHSKLCHISDGIAVTKKLTTRNNVE